LDWTQVAAVGGNDRAEQEMIEEDFPLTWFRWAKAEALAGEGTAEATLAAGPPRVALTVEEDLAPTGWIAARPLRLVEPATRMINLRRNPAAEGTVRALGIVDPQEPLNPSGSRFCDTQGKQAQILFEGAVPAFVLGVVLWTRRAAELHLDPEPDPFDAQLREAAGTAAAKRRPIVDLDRSRQTIALEQLHEHLTGAGAVLGRQRSHRQAIPGGQVEHGQRLNSSSVAHPHRSFEINRPNIIGSQAQDPARSPFERSGLGTTSAPPHHSGLGEPPLQRAHRWAPRPRPLPLQPIMQRLAAPRRSTPTPREQTTPPLLRPTLWLPRPRRPPLQSCFRIPLVPSPPFISGLATDPMRPTQR